MPLGTAAAIAIGLGTAGAQTAASIYNTRSANKTNQQALEAQRQEADRAAELERERLAEERAAREAQLALERERDAERARVREQMMQMDAQRWNDYLSIHQPHWALGANVLGNLYDLAGIPRGASLPASGIPPAGSGGGVPSLFDLASQRVQGNPALSAAGGRGTWAPAMPPSGPAVTSALPTPQPSGGLQSLWDLGRLALMGRGATSRGGSSFLPFTPGAM